MRVQEWGYSPEINDIQPRWGMVRSKVCETQVQAEYFRMQWAREARDAGHTDHRIEVVRQVRVAETPERILGGA